MQGEGAPLSCMGEAGKEAGRPAEGRQAGTPGGKSGGGLRGGWQAQIWAADGSVGSVDVGEGPGVQGRRRGAGVVGKLMPASREKMMLAWACLVHQEWGQRITPVALGSGVDGVWGAIDYSGLGNVEDGAFQGEADLGT